MIKKTIEERLVGNGNIIDAARRKGVSIHCTDRKVIVRARQEAIERGMSETLIHGLEFEGQQGRHGVFGNPLTARFIGAQEMGLFDWKMRLYNLEGDHVLNNSTVSVSTLVRHGILPTDLNFFEIVGHVIREWILFTFLFFK